MRGGLGGGLQRGDRALALAGSVAVDGDARAAAGVGHAVVHAGEAVLGADVVQLLGARDGAQVGVQLGAHRRGGQGQQGAHAGAFNVEVSR